MPVLSLAQPSKNNAPKSKIIIIPAKIMALVELATAKLWAESNQQLRPFG